MGWFDDIKLRRLEREQERARERVELGKNSRLRQAEAMSVLTPSLKRLVCQRLCEMGEAYWGVEEYHLYEFAWSWTLFHLPRSHDAWELCSKPPSDDEYDYWKLEFGPRKEWEQRLLWTVTCWREPHFRITAGPGCWKAKESKDLSEGELRRVLRFAIETGPCHWKPTYYEYS